MAKFIGKLGVVVGYTQSTINGTPSGIYEPVIEEYSISGDVLSNNYRIEQGKSINDNLNISNRFSILATPYLITQFLGPSNENATAPLYLEVYGKKWKVSSFELQLPRVNISIGDLWNEETN